MTKEQQINNLAELKSELELEEINKPSRQVRQAICSITIAISWLKEVDYTPRPDLNSIAAELALMERSTVVGVLDEVLN
jgi:hypothetical protein